MSFLWCFSFWCPEQDVKLIHCLVCFFARFGRASLRLICMRLCGSVFLCQPTHPPFLSDVHLLPSGVMTVCRRLPDLACVVRPRSICPSQRGSFSGGSDVWLTTVPYGTRSFSVFSKNVFLIFFLVFLANGHFWYFASHLVCLFLWVPLLPSFRLFRPIPGCLVQGLFLPALGMLL